MRCYFPIAKIDAEARMVWGYASTDARDDQGEIVTLDALKSALGDYMKFANIREMHQLSAVGVAREAAVDDRGLYIGARIVDERAWEKVVEGVYKGFSIGGRITARDNADRNTITGVAINEISLVDRPANPEAVFDYWKASTRGSEAMPFNAPIQLWACGIPDHRHLVKADAQRCIATRDPAPSDAATAIAAVTKALADAEDAAERARPEPAAEYGDGDYADPGYQADGRKRYPIDTAAHIRAAWAYINRRRNEQKYTRDQLERIRARIIAAWKEKIDPEGPPAAADGAKAARAALRKALSDVGRIADLILSLDWVQGRLESEAAMEGDDSPQPARLQAIVSELCDFLNALVAEETAELVEGDGVMPQSVMMAAGPACGRVLGALRKSGRIGLVERLAKAKHAQGDQALLDLAHHAVHRAIGIAGLTQLEKDHLDKAAQYLADAGAAPLDEMPESDPADPGSGSGAGIGGFPIAVLDAIAAALGKRGIGHQRLLDVAHHCLDALTDGATCSAPAEALSEKVGARHSRETLQQLKRAHDHLVAAGADCPSSGEDETDADKAARPQNLVRTLASERDENMALKKTLADIVPRLDRLAKRVEDIATTPLPPLTLARPAYLSAVSKERDGTPGGGLSAEEVAAAFAKMSSEEQTLTLIKASYQRPIRVPGITDPAEPRER